MGIFKISFYLLLFLLYLSFPQTNTKQNETKLHQDSLATKMSRGKYSNRDQNSKLCNRKRSPSFQRAIIVIVETLRFGYWHLGSIWEEKQNKPRVPRAFPIGSPKCGWYRGLSAPSHLEGGGRDKWEQVEGLAKIQRTHSVERGGMGRIWFGFCRTTLCSSSFPCHQEKREEMVKINLRCAFPDRLCLILPPCSNRPSPPPSPPPVFYFSRPPYP